MGSGQESLSDTLRRMADGEDEAPAPRQASKPPPSALSARAASRAGATSKPRTAPAATRRPARPAPNRLRAVAIPVLLLVGIALLFPAVWAVMLLAGGEVRNHDRPGAIGMARVMLVCWPIALALLGSAVFYMVQPRKR